MSQSRKAGPEQGTNLGGVEIRPMAADDIDPCVR